MLQKTTLITDSMNTPGETREKSTSHLISRLENTAPDSLKRILDEYRCDDIKPLLSSQQFSHVLKMVETVRRLGKGAVVLDSDGTNYLHLPTSALSHEAVPIAEAFLQTLKIHNRLYPGGAIGGEVPQALTYSYRVVPALVDVWIDLAKKGVTTHILSGRKVADLADIYRDALNVVPGFSLFPSKGLVRSSQTDTTLIGKLQNVLKSNPFLTVANAMVEKVGLISEIPQSSLPHDPLGNSAREFEKLSGYRISIQAVGETVVLIRLHHRFRACSLASKLGCPISNLDDPSLVDMSELSIWLLSESPSARACLEQLQDEDCIIKEAFEVLSVDSHAALGLVIKDYVGHRSGSQDFSPNFSPRDTLLDIASDSCPVLIYAGDGYSDTGNDRPFMDQANKIFPDATIFAVKHAPTIGPEVPNFMVSGDQFQLFLSQYLLGRLLSKSSDEPIISPGEN